MIDRMNEMEWISLDHQLVCMSVCARVFVLVYLAILPSNKVVQRQVHTIYSLRRRRNKINIEIFLCALLVQIGVADVTNLVHEGDDIYSNAMNEPWKRWESTLVNNQNTMAVDDLQYMNILCL